MEKAKFSVILKRDGKFFRVITWAENENTARAIALWQIPKSKIVSIRRMKNDEN